MNNTDEKVTILDLLHELQSFIKVDSLTLQFAKEGPPITTFNNAEFAILVEDWKSGAYDEDPETLHQQLITLMDRADQAL